MVKSGPDLPLDTFGNAAAVSDDGQYRLYNLPPGQYAVALSFDSTSQPGRAGVFLYTDSAQPLFLTISGGEEYRGIDFVIPPTPVYHVSGKIAGPVRGGGGRVMLFVIDQPALPVATALFFAPDNSFQLTGIPPGTYDLIAMGNRVSSSTQGTAASLAPVIGRTRIVVSGEDVTGISLSAPENRVVSFILRAPGLQGRPEGCPASAQLSLASLGARYLGQQATAEVNFTKAQLITEISPGLYRVTLSRLGEACFQTSHAIVDLREGSAQSTIAVEVTAAGSILGRLNAGAAKPGEYVVVLVNTDVLDAAQPMQVACPDEEFRFSFPNLRPGRYRIAARRAGGSPGARLVPGLARMFEIEVTAGTPTDVDLSPIPAEKDERP
jgi:hypothetical protein